MNGEFINTIKYAHNTVVCVRGLKFLLNLIREVGLEIYREKFMVISRQPHPHAQLNVGQHKRITLFKYLGTRITENLYQNTEI